MSRPSISPHQGRRTFLKLGLAAGAGLGAVASVPQLSAFASDLADFITGPPVPDIPARQLSEHVWMIHADDGFPTPENQGMMSNITFVVTTRGVVFIDPGSSLQIGEMALRQVRAITDKPVIAVFNSHYHGDHWLANHALVEAYGRALPIYAHPLTRQQIEGVAGNLWRDLLERWTNQATAGTRIVAPSHSTGHGAEFDFGDVTLRIHHYGTAHTPGDICVEVVQDRLTHVGDVAMDRRIANMDDGSFVGTFRFFDALERNAASAIWVPGHGNPGAHVLDWNRELFAGIYENCLAAVEEGLGMDVARKRVIDDPRVAERAQETLGFESNIGKYVSIAYLEAEAAAF